MNYIGMTQQTASWLLTRPAVINCLHELLAQSDQLPELRHADLIEGSFRVSGSPDGRLLAVWHVDYLTGTGNEEWGFVKRISPLGLLDHPEISREVFERSIYIINQRLQGLLIDGAFFHREHPGGAHTCLAGRGTIARQFSISYVETDVPTGSSRSRSIMCVGPSERFDRLTRTAVQEATDLPNLARLANQIIAPHQRRPILNTVIFPSLRTELSQKDAGHESGLDDVTISSGAAPTAKDAYRTIAWEYSDWVSGESPLSSIQRRILESDGILKHPIRIIGPGGSGKTLLMQLLAFRRLRNAHNEGTDTNVIYVVHNAPMARLVRERFETLGVAKFLAGNRQKLDITTLSDYGKAQLQLADTGIIDVDAHETKLFQLSQIQEALRTTFKFSLDVVQRSKLLSQVTQNEDLFIVFSRLVMAEISTAIKGHGLTADKQRYVGNQRPLSRLHGLLDQSERGLIFDAFRTYHRMVFEEMEVLDADDIALSLLGKMRTPIWELKRRTLGYDFVFVDETQLFNENERRIFPLLTKGSTSYVPIVLALDEAQEIYGQSSAGFGALGIKDVENESLPSNYRSTRAIVDLAFFVIQRTTDLFGPDFPDFTAAVAVMEPDDHPLADPPTIELCNEDAKSFPRFIVKCIRDLRKKQLRQIAVICHSELYWDPLVRELGTTDLPVHVLLQRGDRVSPNQPLVILTRPAYVGGQEFDAVIAVGLEQGLVPPRIHENDALASAVEQQALREIYLSFTRARYQLRVVINRGAKPTRVLRDAAGAGLIK
jgi:hypothetical protein